MAIRSRSCEEVGLAAHSLTDRAAIWSLLAGAVILPLAVWPAFDFFIVPKLVVLCVLVLLLLGLRVAGWVTTGRLRGPRTTLDLPLLLLVASAALSTVLAVNVDVAIFGAYDRDEGLITIVCYALLFRLAAQALDREEAWTVARALLLAGYVAALLGIVQSIVAGSLLGTPTEETARTFGGALRATSTFGNADTLGAFLAMLLPLAVHELLRARSAGEKVLAANVLLVIGLGLLLTYSRASWLGAVLGVGIVAGRPAFELVRRRPVAAAAGCGLAAAALVLTAALHSGPAWATAVWSRVTTLLDPTGGSGATRLHIWADTLHLIAARPWVGWGPDTFGLVYPHFQTGDWTPGFFIDKAHSDVLQVAATQGLLGVAAYLGLIVAFAVAFWRGRRQAGALAPLGAWLAYQVPLQLDFSWLPSAAPAWLLMAVAIAIWRVPRRC